MLGLTGENASLVVDLCTTRPVPIEDVLPVPILQRCGSTKAIRIVNQDRCLSRQHIVRMEASNGEVVGGGGAVVVVDLDDRGVGAIGFAEACARGEAGGIDPLACGGVPEGVVPGGGECRAGGLGPVLVGLVRRSDGQVGEVAVGCRLDDAFDSVCRGGSGLRVGGFDLVTGLDVFDGLAVAVCLQDRRGTDEAVGNPFLFLTRLAYSLGDRRPIVLRCFQRCYFEFVLPPRWQRTQQREVLPWHIR